MEHNTLKTKDVPVSRKSAAWAPFKKKLAAVLATLKEDQFLIVSLKHSNRFVQFAAQGAYGMRAETTSNHYLTKQEQLDAKQLRTVESLGWVNPTGTHKESTPEADPDGSPNFFLEFASPVPFDRVAELTIATLTDVIRVPHPSSLEYNALDTQGRAIEFSELGLRRATAAEAPQGLEETASMLLTTMREFTGFAHLDFDSDGDIATRYGSALIFGQLIGDPVYVRFYSPLLRDVRDSPELFERLNELNVNEMFMRFMFQNGVIYVVAETAAVPFVADHIIQLQQLICVVADAMNGQLQEEFGGETSFSKPAPGRLLH